MDLRSSSKFRQTTTGAQLRRRRDRDTMFGGMGPAHDDRQNIRTFSRQLNHYQTQVLWFINTFLFNCVRMNLFEEGSLPKCSLFKAHPSVIFTCKNLNWHDVSQKNRICKCIRDQNNMQHRKIIWHIFIVDNYRCDGADPVSGTEIVWHETMISCWICQAASTLAPPADPPWRPWTRLSPWAVTSWTHWPVTGWGTSTCCLTCPSVPATDCLRALATWHPPALGPELGSQLDQPTEMWYSNTRALSTARMNTFSESRVSRPRRLHIKCSLRMTVHIPENYLVP